MGGWAVWAESDESREESERKEPLEPGEIDDSLEARRLSRWLKAMFGGTKKEEPEEGADQERR